MNEFIKFTNELGEANRQIIRQYFRIPMMVETKADKTPVTAADGKAEITKRWQYLIVDGQVIWLNGNPIRVRDCASIGEATLLTTSHWSADQHRNGLAFDCFSKRARLYRTRGDCYGYYRVATGFAGKRDHFSYNFKPKNT